VHRGRRAALIGRSGKEPPLQVAFFAYSLAVLLISCGLALCSYHALEKPFLRLKRFFEPHGPTTGVS
jgi:peptidoglycan/LPS O-acetylase OafA/YrhL